MKKIKIGSAVTAALISTAIFSACSDSTQSYSSSQSSADVENIAYSQSIDASKLILDDDDYYSEWENSAFTEVTLNGSTAESSGKGVSITDGVIVISSAGTYVLSGTLSDGQVIVEAGDSDDVRIVLNNAIVSCSYSSAVLIKSADKVIISVPENTANTLSDGYSYSDTSDDAPNACLYSKSDLIINGSGSLTINGNTRRAISGRDDLKIVEVNLIVNSVEDGIIGKDSIIIGSGTIVIKASGDAIKSNNDSDISKGFISILGGSFEITAGEDGIQAESSLIISGGKFSITTNGGSANGETHLGGNMGFGQNGGPMNNQRPDSQSTVDDTESVSAKGLKSGSEIVISDGVFVVNSSDDSIHSNGISIISGGDFTFETGDDGIHADTSIKILDGRINITKCYEGIESQNIEISGGDISINASDDGINATGSDSKSNKITISGGYIFIENSGDGIDANGSIYITGGTTIINGTTSNGDGIIDYDAECIVSGGVLIAAGSSGMAQGASASSTQNTIVITLPSVAQAGSIIHIESSQKSIVTFAPSKQYQCLIISSPDIEADTEYTVYTGGTSSTVSKDGQIDAEAYTKGDVFVTFTASNGTTWVNESGVTEGNQGGFGFGGGQGNMPNGTRPDDGQNGTHPDGQNGTKPDWQDGTRPEGAPSPNGAMPPDDENFQSDGQTPS